jgi:hypothetical protein
MKLERMAAAKPEALKLYSLIEDIATPTAIIATVIKVVTEYLSFKNSAASTSDETGSADFTVSTNEAFIRLKATFVKTNPIVYDAEIFTMRFCWDPLASGARVPVFMRIIRKVIIVAIQNWLRHRANGNVTVCINNLEVVIVTAEELYHNTTSPTSSKGSASAIELVFQTTA